MEDIIFLSESKGNSLISWNFWLMSDGSNPAFWARVINAHSVGSPIVCRVGWYLSGHEMFALEASNHVRKKNLFSLTRWLETGFHSWSTIFPNGLYPVPVTLNNDFSGSIRAWSLMRGRNICWTVISFLVKVPVLSVQIIVVDHKVSTDESCLTITFCFANLPEAKERAIEIWAGNHWGTRDIAIPNAKRNAS